MNERWHITGVDLAWGYQMPDAFATGMLEKQGQKWVLASVKVAYKKYSLSELSDQLLEVKNTSLPQLIAVDAPLICRNKTGARPVDRECSALFRKHEAGCHPVNLSLVTRPLILSDKLRQRGITVSKDWQHYGVRAIEVYPHPAMIHWFGIPKTIKYKKGRVAERRESFRTYQEHLQACIQTWTPLLQIEISDQVSLLLEDKWTKQLEDMLDAFFCLLIAAWQVIHRGQKSLTLGDNESGFIIIPTR